MFLVWKFYQTDTNLQYGFVPVDLQKLNEREGEVDFSLIYPLFVHNNLIETKSPCFLKTVRPRRIKLTLVGNAEFVHTYPFPFFDVIRSYLTSSPNLISFEFIGERIRHTSLKQTVQ